MAAIALAAALVAATSALPPREVREMIRDAKTIVTRDGDAIWPGFGAIPFHMILVTAKTDYLFCKAQTAGFGAVGTDPITGCSVQARKRELAVDSSASFDIADEPSMIVMGMPKATGLDRTDWVLTVAHEAFHQYQARLPDRFAKIDALDLAGDSRNAAWMLDYPFPYADPVLGSAIADMTGAGIAFLEATGRDSRGAAMADYVRARRRAMSAVTAEQWRYYEFLIGNEGVARWTELALARAASGQGPIPTGAGTERRLWLIVSLRSIAEQGLGTWKRGAFYVFGAVEAEMLESVDARWREAYRDMPFTFGAQLDGACIWQGCAS